MKHESSFTVPLSRSSDYSITVKADGYESNTIVIHRTVRPVTFVNILFWPGFLLDLATNAMWDPERSQVSIQLEKIRRNQTSFVLPIDITDHGTVQHLEVPVHVAVASN